MILRYNLFTLLWAALILLTTLLPSAAMPPSLSIWDLLSFDSFAHAFMFMVLTFLMIVGLKKQFSFPKLKHYAIRTAFFVSSMFGVCIEVLQYSMAAGRSGDVLDIMSNTFGCLIGIIIFKWIYIW